MISLAFFARARASRRFRHVPAARARAGFTIIETVVVLIIASIAMAISLPRFAAMRDRMSVRSAKQQFASYLATARASAIRQSQQSQFHVKNNTIWTTVNQPSGTNITVGRSVALDQSRGVTVTLGGAAPSDSVMFDARGLGATTGARVYVLTRNGLKDSICVTRLGLIARTCGS